MRKNFDAGILMDNVLDMGGSITTGVLKESIPNPYYGLRKAISEGELVRVKNGVYMLPDEIADTMIDIESIVPGGILCLYSAWSHYGLGTQIPSAYFVAIDTHRRVVVPSYPPVTLCYWQKKYREIGVVKETISGHEVLITDLEKSVCDAVKFRNKVGLDVCAEVLHSYLARPDKSISKLSSYASQMRIAKTLNTYLEMWL